MTRIVAISDTHSYHDHVKLPPGDILVHAGDFSGHGQATDTIAFLQWFDRQLHVHKVLVAGNHDWLAEKDPARFAALLAEHAPSVTYLQDASATIEGLHFFGSPFQPRFLDWAFNCDRGPAIRKHWDLIPANTDVLVTHGPPTVGMLDYTPHDRSHVGDQDLYDAIVRVQPAVWIGGHIHHGYGHATIHHDEGSTLCRNVSICTEAYRPTNPPTIIDLP